MRTNEEIVSLMEQIKDEKQLSISELARRVGMAKSAVSRYFTRERKFPLDRANEFAKALGITPEYLLGVAPKKINSNTIDLSNLRERVVLFDGKPLNDDDVEKISQIIKLSLGVTDIENK